MPLYEYQCRACGYSFEQLRPMKEAEKAVQCPKCHSMKTDRQFSTFAAGGCGPGAASRGFT